MNIAVESPEVGPACKSAWRPDADRRAKALIQQAAKGLILNACSHLFFETALTLGNIWQHLFDLTAVWQGLINRVDGTLKAHKRDGTVISGHCQLVG
ncbi:hypothetical protein ABIB90_007092 [Bradyrhizobium sp. JR4.1]|uniref:hypothetical protein n=1 Tax=Bradyrhizobium sp. JR4.1 TaxID=3156372 RepID=UPI00339216FD